MLLDHIGCFLFPQVMWLRWAGRLAFPLFAFFIGEGARYTHDRKKYLLQLSALGMGCQAVYLIEEIVTHGIPTVSSCCWFFNIILTFTVAAVGCIALLEAQKERQLKNTVIFIIYIIITAGGAFVLWFLRKKTASAFYFDYGFSGILLPLSVCLFDERKKKLISFSLATLIYCFTFAGQMSYVWVSLAVIPLLIMYDGKSGSAKMKYFFYIFYPAHLALLYLVEEFI